MLTEATMAARRSGSDGDTKQQGRNGAAFAVDRQRGLRGGARRSRSGLTRTETPMRFGGSEIAAAVQSSASRFGGSSCSSWVSRT